MSQTINLIKTNQVISVDSDYQIKVVRVNFSINWPRTLFLPSTTDSSKLILKRPFSIIF